MGFYDKWTVKSNLFLLYKHNSIYLFMINETINDSKKDYFITCIGTYCLNDDIFFLSAYLHIQMLLWYSNTLQYILKVVI